MSGTVRKISRWIAATIFIVAATSAISAAQQEKKDSSKQSKSPPAAQQAKSFRLEVSSFEPSLITLEAKNALLTEIAAELKRKLNVPVQLSPLMQKQRVTLEFEGLPLEAALIMLAPHPHVDYVVNGNSASPPRPIAIYLHAINEPISPTSVALKNNTQTIIVEGNTESIGDTSEQQNKPEEEKSLRFSLKDNQLTLFARKQPISAVIYEITDKMGIALEIQHDSNELIDVNYKGASLEDVVRTSLPPTVRFYFRNDLLTRESRPLLISLVSPK